MCTLCSFQFKGIHRLLCEDAGAEGGGLRLSHSLETHSMRPPPSLRTGVRGLPPLECLVGDLCPLVSGLTGLGEGEDWLVCYSFAIYLKKLHNRAETQKSRESAIQDFRFPDTAPRWLSLGLCPLLFGSPRPPIFQIWHPSGHSSVSNSIASCQFCPS